MLRGELLASEPRRLAAIVMADVVGYSTHMSSDDTATFAAVKALENGLVLPGIADYGGRLVKTGGDSFLIEFESALAAVAFSIGLQLDLSAQNAKTAQGKNLQLRIGISVGENILDSSDDVFGNAVNIAARLHPLADPGGICIAQPVYDIVKQKLSDQFIDGGKQQLRGIPDSVNVWRWNGLEAAAARNVTATPRSIRFQQESRRRKRLAKDSHVDELTSRLKKELLKTTEEHPFNVFLCAPTLTERGKASVELSLKLKAALEAENFLVILGADEGLDDPRLTLGLTPQSNELEYISRSCNAVILVADSPSVFSELGLFSWHFVHKKGLLNKTRANTEFILLLDEKYKNSKSYIGEGPARALNGFGQVSYVDFKTFDFGDVLRRIRDRRGVMIVDRRGRPRTAAA